MYPDLDYIPAIVPSCGVQVMVTMPGNLSYVDYGCFGPATFGGAVILGGA